MVYYTLFSDAGQTRPVGAEQVTDGEPLAALHTYFHFSHLPAFAHSSPEFLELHIFKYYPLHPCLQGSRLPTPLACSPRLWLCGQTACLCGRSSIAFSKGDLTRKLSSSCSLLSPYS